MPTVCVLNRNAAIEGDDEAVEAESTRLREGLTELLNGSKLVAACVDSTGDPNLTTCIAENIVTTPWNFRNWGREEEGLDQDAMMNPNPAYTNKATEKPLPAEEVAALKSAWVPCSDSVRSMAEFIRKMMDDEFGAECLQTYETAVYDAANEEMDTEKEMEDLMIDEIEVFVRSAIMKKYMIEKEECPFWYGVPALAVVANQKIEDKSFCPCRVLRQVPGEDVIFYSRYDSDGKYYDRTDPYASEEIAEMVGATLDDGSGKSFSDRFDKAEMDSYIKHFCDQNAVLKKKSKDGANGNGDGGEGGTPEDDGDKKGSKTKAKTAREKKTKAGKSDNKQDKKSKLAGGATKDGADTKKLMEDHGHTYWEVEFGVLSGKKQVCKFENILLDRKVEDKSTFARTHGDSLQVKVEAAYKRVKKKAKYPTDIEVTCLFDTAGCNYPHYPSEEGWCEACVKEVKPNPSEKKMIFSNLKMTNLKANKLAKEMAADTGDQLSAALKISTNFNKNVVNVRGH